MFFLAIGLSAETFRVHDTSILKVNENGEKSSVQCGINSCIAIKLPEDMTFIQGLELSIKVPQIVSHWYNSVAWSFYNDIAPVPDEGVIDYSGSRINLDTFGTPLNVHIKIPLKKNHKIKKDAYSILLSEIPDCKNNIIFYRTQLVMKGADEDIYDAKFDVSCKPIYIDKGKLNLQLKNTVEDAEIQSCTFYVDGKQWNEGDLLDIGNHTFSLVSDFYRNEVRSFIINQAKVSTLDISLRDIAPALRITCPENSKIYLDNQEIFENFDFYPVVSGEHTIKVVVGNYEVVKTVNVKNGRTYSVNVNVDALIEEEE